MSYNCDVGLQLVVGNLTVQATLDQVQTPQDPYPTSKCRLKLFIPAVPQAVLVSFLAQMTFKMTRNQQGDATAIAFVLQLSLSAMLVTLRSKEVRF